MKARMAVRMFGLHEGDFPTFMALTGSTWEFEKVLEVIQDSYPNGPPVRPATRDTRNTNPFV